jgi:S1-C subfamily serine protease
MALLPSVCFAQGAWEKVREIGEPIVVAVHIKRLIGLGTDETDEFTGATGFIADKKMGLVVSNQHVSGNSPLSKIELTFANGESTEAKLYYYDPWHDFAFFKFDPSKIGMPLSEANFGKHSELRKGEEILLIGNSSNEGISVKIGIINSLFVDKAANPLGRHSHHYHTSLARAGGASGSPLFNSKGEVVGLHTSGNENESFELRIDYVTEALQQLRSGSFPQRGDLGLTLMALEIKDALNYLKYSRNDWEAAKKIDPETKHVLVASRIAPDGPAAGKLRVGDLLIALEGAPLGENLYLFDQMVDRLVGKTARLTISRNGRTFDVALPVSNAQEGLPRRFALYAGATFHDVTMANAIKFNIPRTGVFMSQASPGTTFERLGELVDKTVNNRLVIVHQVDEMPTPKLSAFVEAVRSLKQGEKAPVWACDLYNFGLRQSCRFIDVDFTASPLRVFSQSENSMDWAEAPSSTQ